MSKEKLDSLRKLSSILSRGINSRKFTSSISIYQNHSNSINFNISSRFSSAFHSSSSSFISRIEGKPFTSARALFFPSHTLFLGGEILYFLNLKDKVFFCSDSNSTEKCHRCWNCDAEAEDATPFLFCQVCRSIQPVNHSIDYFQIFGLGRNYDIEVEELERKYKDWQKKLHPDVVHSKSQRERQYAAEQSAHVIDAYRTLADFLSRAIYIMKLEGVIVDEEERITDMELLAEVMELREAVEEANGTEALIQIQSQLQEKLQYWSRSFENSFLSKKYEDAVSSIQRMTYYRRTNEEIVKKL